MKFTVTSKSIIGKTSSSSWSQTYSSTHAFVVLEIEGKDARKKGMALLKKLEQQIEEQDPQTSKQLNKHLNSLSSENLKINFLTGLIVGTKLYLEVNKSGQIWLSRKGKKARVLNFTGSASGIMKIGDMVLLIGAQLADCIGQKNLDLSLDLKNIDSIAETLTTKLHQADQVPPGAAMVLQITKAAPTSKISQWSVSEVKKIYSNIASWLSQIYTQLARRAKKSPLRALPIIFSILLLASVGFGLIKQKFQRDEDRLSTLINQVEHQVEEGTALIDLNPIRARELLSQAKTSLESELPQVSSSQAKDEIKLLLEKTNQAITLALRQHDVQLDLFFELSLIKKGAKGADISLYQDILAVLDTENKSIYTISIGLKSSRVVSGGERLRQAKAVAVHGEDIYVLGDEVWQVTMPAGGLGTAISPDEEWGDPVDLAAYAGNLYLLDTQANQIWKYFGADTGFSSKQKYLRMDTIVDFSGVDSIVIDGSIWVIKEGEIRKFVQGEKKVWKLDGLDEGLGSNIDIYTDDLLENLYVLDQEKNRVVVVDKNGTYLAQYRWSDAKTITDFVVSEQLKKILLLSHDTIYEIGTK